MHRDLIKMFKFELFTIVIKLRLFRCDLTVDFISVL